MCAADPPTPTSYSCRETPQTSVTMIAGVYWDLPDGPIIAINSPGLKYADIPFRMFFFLPNAYNTNIMNTEKLQC